MQVYVTILSSYPPVGCLKKQNKTKQMTKQQMLMP